MKKLIFITALFLVTLRVFAQDCAKYYYMQKNKTFEMTYYDNKEKATLKADYKVDDVTHIKDTTVSTVTTQMYGKDGKEIGKTTMDVKCNGGVMYIDVNAALQKAIQPQDNKTGVSMTFSHSYMEYPADLHVGQQFPDVSSTMTVGTADNQQISTTKTTDRKVEAKEDVTTPAGTWSCYKITSKSITTTTYKGAVADEMNKISSVFKKKPKENETTVYYAPNFGIVKMEMSTGSVVLTAIN